MKRRLKSRDTITDSEYGYVIGEENSGIRRKNGWKIVNKDQENSWTKDRTLRDTTCMKALGRATVGNLSDKTTIGEV